MFKVAGLIALLLTVCSGCGDSLTQAVSGTVTLDGQPIASGEIEFSPTEGTGGPAPGGLIHNGSFEVEAVEQGLRTGGTYLVRIYSRVGRGNFAKDPNAPGGKSEVLENIIPERYNENTELKITVSADASKNVHEFALTSK